MIILWFHCSLMCSLSLGHDYPSISLFFRRDYPLISLFFGRDYPLISLFFGREWLSLISLFFAFVCVLYLWGVIILWSHYSLSLKCIHYHWDMITFWFYCSLSLEWVLYIWRVITLWFLCLWNVFIMEKWKNDMGEIWK
jgi:hypothetical protein